MPQDLKHVLAEYSRRVEQRMRECVPREEGSLLSEAAWHHLETGGKRIRPALCLATCEALGGRVEEALDFALAVELLHNMLLVHDDLQDEDRVRRDRPTVWVEYGEANAVNVSDYLLGLAYNAILRSRVPAETCLALVEAFTFAYQKTVEGQDLDLNSRADPAFTVERYERIVTLKTGYYLALGMVGGAIIAGAGEAVVDRLWEFGKFAGPAFQVQDDILDLTVGKGRGGALGCDISEGKPSILYAHALAHAVAADRERLIEIMGAERERTRAADVEWVIELYREVGSIDFARAYAADLLRKAKEIVEELPLEQRETLRRLTDFVTNRAT